MNRTKEINITKNKNYTSNLNQKRQIGQKVNTLNSNKDPVTNVLKMNRIDSKSKQFTYKDHPNCHATMLTGELNVIYFS